MRLFINGEAAELPSGLTARQLVEHLKLAGARIALEVNGEIVPRSTYPERHLNDGDKVEIIHAVGGG